MIIGIICVLSIFGMGVFITTILICYNKLSKMPKRVLSEPKRFLKTGLMGYEEIYYKGREV